MKPQRTRDVKTFLRSIGWVFLRSGQGSHEIWGLPDESVKASIPAGHGEVSAAVLRQVERQIEKAGEKLPREWR